MRTESSKSGSLLRAGARLFWRERRVWLGVHALQLALAFLASLGLSAALGRVLDFSPAARGLAEGFDGALVAELFTEPQGSLYGTHAAFEQQAQLASLGAALVFLALSVFLSGGLLQALRSPRPCETGEFFAACARHFRRLATLGALLGLTAGALVLAARSLRPWVAAVADRQASETLEALLGAARLSTLLVLLGVARLVFDMLRVAAVAAPRERRWRGWLPAALGLTGRNFLGLSWVYVLTALPTYAAFLVAAWLFVALLPSERTLLSFALGQALLLFWSGARLWQRACETVCFERFSSAAREPPAALEQRRAA